MFECFLGFVGVFLGFGWGFFVGGGGGWTDINADSAVCL